jgi:GT2 family glycosyltransferase
MTQRRVLIHIVTFNSAETIVTCVEHASSQKGFSLGETLVIRVTDNASNDGTLERLKGLERRGIEIHANESNLGFCGAHNQGAARCVHGKFDAMLVLNPDVGLSATCLLEMDAVLSDSGRVGIVTPKLLRAASDLSPLSSGTIDAAGMVLTSSLRHFDRGSGEADSGRYDTPQAVFGATGACLLISRACVQEVLIPDRISDEPVWRIYPQLRDGSSQRVRLFDEAFFAYREDADLSWRAGRLGWTCVYTPAARATHVRVVTPERRATLPRLLNRLSVRNRFLLQFNNWDLSSGVVSLLNGLVLRNLLVVAGVVLREHSSLPGLWEALRLSPRARSIYRSTRKTNADKNEAV